MAQDDDMTMEDRDNLKGFGDDMREADTPRSDDTGLTDDTGAESDEIR